MNNKIITISKAKENVLEFDISVDGVDDTDMRMMFVLHVDKLSLMFEGAKTNSKWKVIVPELPFIDATAYTYSVTVVVDGYYFEVAKGTVDVVKSAQIYVNSSTNKTLKPASTDIKNDKSVKLDSAPAVDVVKKREDNSTPNIKSSIVPVKEERPKLSIKDLINTPTSSSTTSTSTRKPFRRLT